jgi:hypothetical protein
MSLQRIIAIALIFFFPLFTQSTSPGDPEEHLRYEADILEQVQNDKQEPLTNSAFSVQTRTGIRHFRIKDIRYLDLNNPVEIIIHNVNGIERLTRAEVEFFHVSRVTLPDRPLDAAGGTECMLKLADMDFAEREAYILREILNGNIPDISREFVTCRSRFEDAKGVSHIVEYDVMSDYLSIGENADYCRIPIRPQTAQAIADAFHCILPTRLLCDDIWRHARIRLQPVTFNPEGDLNSGVIRFIEHNSAINAVRDDAGAQVYELIAGIKKDVIICNALKKKPGYVAIYGWHNTDGVPIQPLYTGHVDHYVDYSHGVRLINAVFRVDGIPMHATNILRDPVLYKLISDEDGIMEQPFYIY